jgi:type I restriction enzyme R subunit
MNYNSIAETNNFIVLDKYTKFNAFNDPPASFQSENSLEREFIQDLIHQGYENPTYITSNEAMLANVRTQLQALNDVTLPIANGNAT